MTRDVGPILLKFCLQHVGLFMHFAMFILISVYLMHSLCDQGWGGHSAPTLVTTFKFVYACCNVHPTSFYFRHSLCDQRWGPHSAQIVFTMFMFVYAIMSIIHSY